MKVLMTADTIGGVWTYAIELAAALRPLGVEVELATMGQPLAPTQRAAADAADITVHESKYRLEWMDDPWEDVARAGSWLLELADDIKPELVHLNGYAHGALEWPCPVLVVGHSCVLSWWEAVRSEAPPSQWVSMYRQQVRRGCQQADLIVAPSLAMLSLLERWYGPLPATRVIYNGRSDLGTGMQKKEPLILAAGRVWDEAKNLAMLARAAPELKWPVVIAGSQQQPGGRKKTLPHVRTLGHIEPAELWRWLTRASIYALPARYEPFGLSALEAALCGCALVLGRIASLREIWRDAALYVDPDDDKGLAKTINRLTDDWQLRQEMAARARSRAMGFSTRRMAQQYADTYAQLRGRPSRSALGRAV